MKDFNRLKELQNNCDGYIKAIGIVLTQVDDGYAKGEIVITKEHLNPINSVHGGCIFSLADTIGGVAALSKGYYVTTVDSSIHYLNPAMDLEKLIAEAKIIKCGKRFSVVDISILSEKDILISKATITYYNLRKEVELFNNE